MGSGTLVLCLFLYLNIVQGSEVTITDQVFFDVAIGDKAIGRIVFGLFGQEVPKTVKNFAVLASTGMNGKSYVGSQFHRVIKNFMIQGGDVVNGDGTGTTSIYGELFADESFNVKHSEAGIISMANSGPDTNGCQFFITTAPAPWLDGKHVAFGKVLSGLEVVHLIEETPTNEENKPEQPVVVTNAGVLKAEPIKLTLDTFK